MSCLSYLLLTLDGHSWDGRGVVTRGMGARADGRDCWMGLSTGERIDCAQKQRIPFVPSPPRPGTCFRDVLRCMESSHQCSKASSWPPPVNIRGLIIDFRAICIAPTPRIQSLYCFKELLVAMWLEAYQCRLGHCGLGRAVGIYSKQPSRIK